MNSNTVSLQFRTAVPQDVPSLKKLWSLAFHDEGAYVEHFFQKFSPKQMFLALKEEEIFAMTYVFPSVFHHKGKAYETAYLYAVATHPSGEKQGIASALLQHLCQTLSQEGYSALSTVPATPSLHQFFGKNGFFDYFVYEKSDSSPSTSPNQPLSMEDYCEAREKFLQTQSLPYITLSPEGFSYQEGVCALGQGGFFQNDTGIYCVEQASDTAVLVKEAFFQTNPAPNCSLEVLETRSVPKDLPPAPLSKHLPRNWGNFGMIQWISPPPSDFSYEERGYLGLAFD